jgi:uncharacterized protein (DUF2252 family)
VNHVRQLLTPPPRTADEEVPQHATPAEHAERGRGARLRMSLAAHAESGRGIGRDPVALLEREAGRREPRLLPDHFGRMLSSPLAFHRGAAAIMAHDLLELPGTALSAQLCGDAHLFNFGLFASRDRRTVFDIEDFDQSVPGPFEWDVKRLAASLAIAGRARGLTAWSRRRVVLRCVARYRATMQYLAGRGYLAVWSAAVDASAVDGLLTSAFRSAARRPAGRAVPVQPPLDALTAVIDGRRRLLPHPPLVVPMPTVAERAELMGRMQDVLAGCAATFTPERRRLLRRYHLVDLAREQAGSGAALRTWILLLVGRDENDPLLLRLREAVPPALAGPAGSADPGNQGERVVGAQRLLEVEPDLFLGWQRVRRLDGRDGDFYLRGLPDRWGAVVLEDMEQEAMSAYGALCGATLARAHARSGDGIAIAAYLGAEDSFDRAVAAFAESYADRTEDDHLQFREAARTGRIVARTGR